MPVIAIGEGLSQDFGFGWHAGITYDFAEVGVDGLSLGLSYKSSINMTFDGQISTALEPFVALGVFSPLSDDLEQPAEYGVGIAYVMGEHTFAFDYKKLTWSDASGYSDFGWEDSNVYAVGYEYQATGWAMRLGYNYGKSAVVEQDGRTAAGAALNFFNLMGFPATQEHHYTMGGTYEFSEMLSADLAYIYAPASEKEFGLEALGAFGFPNATIANSHSENSFTFQINFKF